MTDSSQVVQARHRRWVILGIAGVMFVWCWWTARQLQNAAFAHAIAAEVLAVETRQSAALRLQRERQIALIERADTVKGLAERMPRSAILRALGEAMPTGVALDRLRLTTQRMVADAPDRLDYQIQLAVVGRADSARETSAFVSRLRTSGFFSDLGTLRMAHADSLHFEADLEVEVGL